MNDHKAALVADIVALIIELDSISVERVRAIKDLAEQQANRSAVVKEHYDPAHDNELYLACIISERTYNECEYRYNTRLATLLATCRQLAAVSA